MARKRTDYLRTSKKYDVPLYCGSWLPYPAATDTPDAVEKKVTEASILVGGGGGGGNHGIPNQIVMAKYSFVDNELSNKLYYLDTGDEPSFNMAVHPGGKDVVIAFGKACKWYEIQLDTAEKRLCPSDRQLEILEGSELKFLVFSPDGSKLAVGGEDKRLRVFDWNTLDVILDVDNAHAYSLKDADFSLDGEYLATTAEDGPGHVWDLEKKTSVANLTVKEGSRLGLVRFSRDSVSPFLFATAVRGGKGWLVVWHSATFKHLGVKQLNDEPISAFAISPNSTLLATGSPSGDVAVVSIRKMEVVQKVKSAHMVFVTAVAFSPDSRALLSVSADSSARVTALAPLTNSVPVWKVVLLIILMMLFTAVLTYIWNENSEWFYQFPMGKNQPAKPWLLKPPNLPMAVPDEVVGDREL